MRTSRPAKGLLLCGALLAAAAFASCTTLSDMATKRPTAEVKSVKIDSVSLDDITLKLEIAIMNPYSLSVDVDKAVVEAFVEDTRLMYTASNSAMNIKGNETMLTSFKVKLRWNELSRATRNYEEKEELTVKMVSLFNIKLPDIPGLPESVMLTFATEKIVPALKPEFHVEGLRFSFPSRENIGRALVKAKKSPVALVRILGLFAGDASEEAAAALSDMDLLIGCEYDLVVENRTRGRLQIQRIDYRVDMSNVPFMMGSTVNVENAGSRSRARLANQLNTRSLHRALGKVFNEKTRSMTVKGEAVVKFPDEISVEPVTFYFYK